MKKKNLIRLQDITFGTIAVSSLFLLLGANGAFAATSAVDEVTITVPASCSLTNTIGSPHTATIETGVYQDDIGETTFKVFCNDNEGFAVYAVGYTNDEFGNTTMKPSTLAVSNAIATGTATSGSTSNWAMKLTAVSGDYAPTLETGFNDYHVIPDTYTKVASYASNTDGSTGSSFKSTYGAFVSQTQPADSYTGKVKYTVVHPANADTPLRKTIDELTYMQDFNNLSVEDRASVTLSMQYNTTYNLIDNRDNKTYQVARLKDDNIWMAENLDLGRTTLTQNLTSQNTNLDANVATITASTFNSWINSSEAYSYTSAGLIPLTTSNTSNHLDTDSVPGLPYGTIYNYCAASAGTICAEGRTNNDNATSDICPAGWRLPNGGDSGELNTLYNLPDYDTVAEIRAPIADGGLAFTFSGYIGYGSAPKSQGMIGDYWTSTRFDGDTMDNFTFYSSYVYPTGGRSRDSGASIRCVAKRPFHSLTINYSTGIAEIRLDGKTIQDGETITIEDGTYPIVVAPSLGYGFTSWSATAGLFGNANVQATTYTLNNNATLTADASYVATEMQNLSQNNCTTTASQVRDVRDNHVYKIQRLADGKCWMMENLDLGRTALTTDLTSSNTNLTNTVTASTFNGWKKTIGSSTYTAGEFISLSTTNTSNQFDADPVPGSFYGTLYNYCATSAGTICSDKNSNNNDATSDICPAGWRLPTGGSSGEFQALYNLTDYNTNTKMRAPSTNNGAAFALAGYFGSYSPDYQGSDGRYWSSTRYNNSSMNVLYLTQGYVYPNYQGTIERNYGYSIRCVAN